MTRPFYSIYTHGFIRVAVAIPSVRVADCNYNVERTLHLARRASENYAAVVLFPELRISAYSNEDLFHQDALLDQDFNLYHLLRFGFRPSKVAFLAYHAWGDKTRGSWPDFLPEEKRNEYDLTTIKKWLKVFLYRFFKTSQFKRSALPNAPKVGSGGSLSPRSDWRAPCDSEATAWLKELEENVPD